MSAEPAPPVPRPAPRAGIRPWARSSVPARPGVGSPLLVGFAALVALLALLGMAPGLGPAGWAVGLGCGAILTVALAHGLSRAAPHALGPADRITLGRGLLACAVAALTVEALLERHVTLALLALTVMALVLDAVDGRVARRTGTVTAFGGRFDGEVDAFLILVLSAYVAPSIGWWALTAGLARYGFAVGGWVLPWLRGRLEFRYWRKVVTAAVGIMLTVAAADVLPHGVSVAGVGIALLLLAESFGRDVAWLWRRRPRPHGRDGVGRGRRPGVAVVATVAALALVWFALLAPTRPDRFTPLAFARVPAELVLVGGLALVLAARPRAIMAVLVGMLLGVVTLLKLLDLGSFAVLDRPFDLVTGPSQLGSALDFVRASMGPVAANAGVVGAVLLVGVLLIGLPWAVRRLTGVLARHRRGGARTLGILAIVWLLAAGLGLQVAPGQPVDAADAGRFVAGSTGATVTAFRDEARFDRALLADPYRDPGTADLSSLRGKDVVLAFVESYGRVAVEGPDAAPVRSLLDTAAARLRASGFTARSAYLTSSTFGGSSWLAHATMQSGLDVDGQGRYDRLLASDRTTLTSAFARAGWRTVAVMPSTHGRWPEGRRFYRFDEVYGRASLGYAGPSFGWSPMPDQYALSAFERLELDRQHPPVMTEIELTSSHVPWAPLPTTVDWGALGDGSVFRGIQASAVPAARLWSDPANVPAAYRTSIAYSLTSLLSFVQRHADDDLVVIMLGDHQPSTIVSGYGAGRDVPVTVIAHDPKVIQQIADWGWRPGLRPDEHAPVWPMEAFRDRFLAAFSDPPSPGSAAPPGRAAQLSAIPGQP